MVSDPYRLPGRQTLMDVGDANFGLSLIIAVALTIIDEQAFGRPFNRLICATSSIWDDLETLTARFAPPLSRPAAILSTNFHVIQS
ncbi:MAG: hypothetical protein KJZ93_02525, partial [Caldilineaceae bacterium]|nr:hypothetical protein [Caldilineaceae bacterium]